MYRLPLLLLVVTFLLALVRACPLHLYLGFAAGVVFSFYNEPSQFIKAAWQPVLAQGETAGVCSQQ